MERTAKEEPRINWNMNIREGRIVSMPPEEYIERVNIFNRYSEQEVLQREMKADKGGYQKLFYIMNSTFMKSEGLLWQ